MYYQDEKDEQPDQQTIRPYVSDNTSFMRWSTELEKIHDLIDQNFLENHRERIIDINKFLPLANITSAESNSLFRLRRMNMTMARDAELRDLAEETALDNVADYNTTRGQNGFYQKALITQRREWKDQSENDKKKPLFGRIFGQTDKQDNMNETLTN